MTTQVGNDRFTWFGTTFSKSRLNFLELLRAGREDDVVNDVVNDAALAYMRERSLSAGVIARLKNAEDRHFPDLAAWTAHMEWLGIDALKVHPDPVRIATAFPR